MITEGETCFLLEAGNVDELAAIIQTCDAQPEQLKEMELNARNYAEVHFSEDQSYTRLMKIYRELGVAV